MITCGKCGCENPEDRVVCSKCYSELGVPQSLSSRPPQAHSLNMQPIAIVSAAVALLAAFILITCSIGHNRDRSSVQTTPSRSVIDSSAHADHIQRLATTQRTESAESLPQTPLPGSQPSARYEPQPDARPVRQPAVEPVAVRPSAVPERPVSAASGTDNRSFEEHQRKMEQMQRQQEDLNRRGQEQMHIHQRNMEKMQRQQEEQARENQRKQHDYNRQLEQNRRKQEEQNRENQRKQDEYQRQMKETQRKQQEQAENDRRRNQAITRAQEKVADAQKKLADANATLNRDLSSSTGATWVESDRRRVDSAQRDLSNAQRELADVMRRGW